MPEITPVKPLPNPETLALRVSHCIQPTLVVEACRIHRQRIVRPERHGEQLAGTGTHTAETRTAQNPKEKKIVNLVDCGFWASTGIEWSERGIYLNRGHDFAFGVAFINKPIVGQKVLFSESVQAEIIFKLTNGSVYETVHHGLWIGENFNYASMDINAKRELVICVVQDKTQNVFGVKDERENAYRSPDLEYIEILKEQPYDIDINLVAKLSSGYMHMPTVRYRLTFDPFSFNPIDKP